jgi:hypothetical protein
MFLMFVFAESSLASVSAKADVETRPRSRAATTNLTA